MAVLLILFSLTVALLSWPMINLIRNYNEARKIGLPILITPVSIMGPIWSIFEDQLGPLLKKVPFGLCNFVDYSGFGWFWRPDYPYHEKYGPAFIIVTPSEIQIILADAKASDDVLSRRKDFIKSPAMYKPLEIFGPNVDTVNGENWQRHRRITTPPFNERTSSHVWRESVRQAGEMLNYWMTIAAAGVTTTPRDALTMTLNVLTSAGFGKSYPFEEGSTSLQEGHTMSHREALHEVLSNLYTTIIITSTGLPNSVLPRGFIKVRTAIDEFRAYMLAMVQEEKASIQQDAEKDNLLSVLVRVSAQEDGSQGRNGLTDEEMLGNLFVYSLAGHETTGNTLSYAVVLLAVDDHWQAWVREEIKSVFGSQKPTAWEYEKAFPKMTRCLALMYETLRLFGPVIVIPKYTCDSPTTLEIQGKTYTLPPNIYVPINSAAIHILPSYWGEDALTWRPDRWIVKSESGVEQLYQPPPGTFLPWASGPRVCPGKKFSQVEFVATIARLFCDHKASPVLEKGETVENAKKRVMGVVEDSDIVITLQMLHPEKIKLVWEDM